MKPDKAALQRLRRLERVREVAKQTAAMQAAEAEGTLGQLTRLRDRTREIAATCRPSPQAMEGGDLRRLQSFADGIGRLTEQTEQDIGTARSRADALRGDLVVAERRLTLASDRAATCRKALQQEKPAEAPARRRNWHDT